MRSIHAAENYVKSNDTNHLTTGIPIPMEICSVPNCGDTLCVRSV